MRAAFEGWLAQHGYDVAPVTMENSDWVFALVYDDAVLRHDTAAVDRVRTSYVAYTSRVVSWYREAAFGLLGRRPAFVFLLHATRLNADSLGALTKIIKGDGLRPVSLTEAMDDPAYRIPDAYAGPNGDEWLTRWAATLHKDLPWSTFPQPPADVVAEDQRLDGVGTASIATPTPE